MSIKLLNVAVIVLSVVSFAQAQGKSAKAPVSSMTKSEESAPSKSAESSADFKNDFIKATEEYKTSLQTLAGTYESSAKKISEQNGKLKELYAEGLIARREVEASDRSLAEAHAKLDEIKKQLASIDSVLEAARKGPSPDAASSQQASLNAASTAERVTPAWSTGNKRIDALINYYGNRYGVDPYLIYCVMHQESRFTSVAVSVKGAQGLMQLMPGTAARYGVTNPYDPAQNIMGGTRYLKDLLVLFKGRVDLVLAGYNAGEGAVMKYGNRIPPYRETQDYVRNISRRYMNSSNVVLTSKKAPVKKKSTR